MNDLPLSELRRALLDTLDEAEGTVGWASVQLLTWGRRRGYIERVGLSTGHRLTDLGLTVLHVDREHSYRLDSRVIGLAPIGHGRIHGARLDCRCGKRYENNERPASPGGHTALKRLHRAHVAGAFGQLQIHIQRFASEQELAEGNAAQAYFTALREAEETQTGGIR